MDRYEASTLRAYYGKLLTERQNEILRLHFDEDISYGELAEMFSISRQAACDAVRKGCEVLARFEDKLRSAERDRQMLSVLGELEAAAACSDVEGVKSGAERLRAIMEE